MPLSRFAYMNLQQNNLPIIDYGVHVNPILETEVDQPSIEMKGRNSRKPKKSNHGARPCSSYMRQLKKKGWYHILRGD